MSDIQSITLKKQDQVAAWVLGVVGLLILGGLGYGLFLLMPFLVALAKNTIIFFVELLVLVAMGIGVLSLWAERDTFIYKWKNFVRNFRRAIVKEDPIGVLETAIKRFARRLSTIEEKISEAIAALNIQVESQRKLLKSATDKHNLYQAAKAAQKSEEECGRYATASLRASKAAEEMQPMIDLLTQMKGSFEQARDLAAITMKDLEDQKQVMGIKLQASKAGQSAVKAFKAFFGKSDESDWAMMAFDELESQINTAEAEIEQFMRVMDPALKEEKLKNQAEAIAAMNRMNGFAQQKSLNPVPASVELVSAMKVDQKVGKQVQPGIR